METITDIKKSFPRHQIPGGYSHYHPTLLQGRYKRKGKNLGLQHRDSTTNSHQLAWAERKEKIRTDPHSPYYR